MSKQHIAQLYSDFDKVKEIVNRIQKDNAQIGISNLSGSSLSMVISSVYQAIGKPLLLICGDKEEAAYFLNDLEQLLDADKSQKKHDVLFYPGSYRRPYQNRNKVEQCVAYSRYLFFSKYKSNSSDFYRKF